MVMNSETRLTKIDFYYWGVQCPYNDMILTLLKNLDVNRFVVNIYDVSMDYKVAKEVNMYSPTLLIFNKSFRWNGPINLDKINSIAEGINPKGQPYMVQISSNVYKGVIEYLTEENIGHISTCCSPQCNIEYCLTKGKWIRNIRDRYKLPHLGVLNYKDNKCIGGAEFVPSLSVPYDIPKADDTAFLTCSYLSDEEWDYRSYPLQVLEDELKGIGYKKLIAIASEDVVFPNGTLAWFLEREYKDLGEICYEEDEFARMHLIEKIL